MNHIVQQTITLGDNLRQHVSFLAIELKALSCSYPRPASRVLKNAVHVLASEFGRLRQVFHILEIGQSFTVVPGVGSKWCLIWS